MRSWRRSDRFCFTPGQIHVLAPGEGLLAGGDVEVEVPQRQDEGDLPLLAKSARFHRDSSVAG